MHRFAQSALGPPTASWAFTFLVCYGTQMTQQSADLVFMEWEGPCTALGSLAGWPQADANSFVQTATLATGRRARGWDLAAFKAFGHEYRFNSRCVAGQEDSRQEGNKKVKEKSQKKKREKPGIDLEFEAILGFIARHISKTKQKQTNKKTQTRHWWLILAPWEGGRAQENMGSRPDQANNLWNSHLQNNQSKMNWRYDSNSEAPTFKVWSPEYEP
jgi:hypothetical protein